MRNQLSFLSEESLMGPGTDLIISLVAVLVAMISISKASFQQKEKEFDQLKAKLDTLVKVEDIMKQDSLIKQVKEDQKEIINGIAAKYNSTPKQNPLTGVWKIPIYQGQDTITIYNDVTLQRIRFGNKILFKTGDDVLQFAGQQVIKNVAQVLFKKSRKFKEIQIQGHADTVGVENENLALASRRAIAVYNFLISKEVDAFNPISNLMSASSYGQYSPVQRSIEDVNFSRHKLTKANASSTLMSRNRRIEIVLNYRGDFILHKNKK